MAAAHSLLPIALPHVAEQNPKTAKKIILTWHHFLRVSIRSRVVSLRDSIFYFSASTSCYLLIFPLDSHSMLKKNAGRDQRLIFVFSLSFDAFSQKNMCSSIISNIPFSSKTFCLEIPMFEPSNEASKYFISYEFGHLFLRSLSWSNYLRFSVLAFYLVTGGLAMENLMAPSVYFTLLKTSTFGNIYS